MDGQEGKKGKQNAKGEEKEELERAGDSTRVVKESSRERKNVTAREEWVENEREGSRGRRKGGGDRRQEKG